MKRIVWKFGTMAAGVLAVALGGSMALRRAGWIDMDGSEVIGYSSMVLAFVLVFFGIRAYRDEVAGGAIGFGTAFGVGLLMSLIACAGYVAAWQVIYWGFYPDFLEEYSAERLAQMRADGEPAAAIAAARTQMDRFAELYRNPLFNVGITFLEVFPVGLIMTAISAAILRRRPPAAAAAARSAA